MWPFNSTPKEPRCESRRQGEGTHYTRKGVAIPQGIVIFQCERRGEHNRHYVHDYIYGDITWLDSQAIRDW